MVTRGALHTLLQSNAQHGAASHEQMRRLQRENEQLRDEIDRLRSGTDRIAPAGVLPP